jgi:hypothetical protein
VQQVHINSSNGDGNVGGIDGGGDFVGRRGFKRKEEQERREVFICRIKAPAKDCLVGKKRVCGTRGSKEDATLTNHYTR